MAKPNPRDLASAVHNAENPAQPAAGPDTARRVPKTRKGTKGVLTHVTPTMSKALRQLALDEDTTTPSARGGSLRAPPRGANGASVLNCECCRLLSHKQSTT